MSSHVRRLNSREFFSRFPRSGILVIVAEPGKFALVPKTPTVLEKAQPGTKRVLSGIVADALELAKKEAKEPSIPPQPPLGLCPACGGKVYETDSGYVCERSQVATQPCKFKYGKQLFNQLLGRNQIKKLLETGRTDILNGFITETGLSFSAYLVIDQGKLAFEFPQTSQRITREFELKWRFGARTAGLIVKIASKFASSILISRGNEAADAKSFMDLCSVSADMSKIVGSQMPDFRSDETTDIGCGDLVRISVEGSDSAEAMEALAELFTCGSRVERCIEPTCSSKPALIGYTKDYISYSCKKGHGWEVPRLEKS